MRLSNQTLKFTIELIVSVVTCSYAIKLHLWSSSYFDMKKFSLLDMAIIKYPSMLYVFISEDVTSN